jgi:isopentenyl diphosphate isomerase/L-lactate dehydrogenase-like FMN-dependent dehydrogenase
MMLKVGWLWRMRSELNRITFGNYVRPDQSSDIKALAGKMPGMLDQAMSWKDVDALRGQWKGPLVLKGVLHPDEAREAIQHGVDGVIVSNHGGRQLDGAPSSLDVLPAVARAVDEKIPLFLDGGVRRGANVVKALALGATACFVGRPQLWGLSAAGADGVAHMLDLFRSEIDRVMALCGLRNLREIGTALLTRSSDAGPPLSRVPSQLPSR